MDRAGGFRVGGRVFVRADDLDAFERAQADERQRLTVPAVATASPQTRRARPAKTGERLAVDWWEAKA